MKIRERDKYKEIEKYLVSANILHEFEFRLEEKGALRIYDLALLNHNVFIEFDGKYHRCKAQRQDDIFKDTFAKKQGWSVYRIETDGEIPKEKVISVIKTLYA